MKPMKKTHYEKPMIYVEHIEEHGPICLSDATFPTPDIDRGDDGDWGDNLDW